MTVSIVSALDEALRGIGRGIFVSTPGIVFGLSIGLAYDTSNMVAAGIYAVTTLLVWYATRGDLT